MLLIYNIFHSRCLSWYNNNNKNYNHSINIKAMFTQQQNMVVSPVFESLIQLRSHTERLFAGVTTAFCNRTHTCKFSGLTTAFSEHTRCERNRTGQLVVCHVIQRERATLPHKRATTVWFMFSCVFSVAYSDWEMSCVSSESFRSRQFCVLRAIQMLHYPPKYKSCCWLMKIWQKISQLDWTLVVSESDKTFSFMHVAIFDFTLVTVAMVTSKEYGLDALCTFIQTVF